MKKSNLFCQLVSICSAVVIVCCIGCSEGEISETAKNAEKSAEKAADTISKEAGKAAEKGEKLAADLGEKAMAFLSPLKEKFGNLESLKESPEKLKEAVSGLIETIDKKADAIQLPESIGKALTGIKEKLVALKTYLEGEFDQAKVGEQVDAIMKSVKSGLGMTDK